MATQKPVLKKTRHLQFIASMKSAQQQKDVEKAVENGYNSYLKDYYDNHPGYKKAHIEHSYPHNTDGVITIGGTLALDGSGDDERKILIEAKKDLDFMGKRSDIARVLTQVVFYLKKFQKAGQVIPKVVICGDNDEIFAAPTTLVRHYLDNDYDWSVAPSEAYVRVPELYNALLEDKNIRPYIRVINENFDGEAFLQSVDAYLNEKPLKKEPVTTANLERLFMDFSWRIFGGEKSVKNQTQIDIFINGLKGSENVFPHPIKPNVIMLNGDEFSGNSEAFVAFWNHYDSNNYSLAELKAITEIADTLIEEFDRRFTGDFWTPKIWGDEAHNMIERNLGEDWRDNYFVWDPACGAKNLTRDYHFSKGLYSTTLHSEELSISDQYNTGENEHAFQYDFLNDDMLIHEIIAAGGTKDDIMARAHELKLVQSGGMGLLQALYDNEPIVFFANPPYGQSGSGQKKKGSHKAGVNNTAIGGMMEGMGHARMELYTQFIYRAQLLANTFGYEKDFHIFFFSKVFLTSPNFSNFVNNLTDQFSYNDGFMINAGEFSGTSSAWGIIFSHWSLIGTKNQNEFNFDVLKSHNGGVVKIGNWLGRSVEKGNTISDWLHEIPLSPTVEKNSPLTGNGFEVAIRKYDSCKMRSGWIGYLLNDANTVMRSDKYTSFYSFGYAGAHGRDVTPDNLTRVAVTFSIRRSVQEKIAEQKLLWVRDKDIFTRPSDALANNAFFTHDCMVYSLFDRQSNQTSLRNYEYNGVKHRVENEFFPFSRDFITSLASKDGQKNLSIEQDMEKDKNPRRERIVHTWLQDHSDDMTPEGKRLLDAATVIWEHSFKYRKDYIENSRYQLNSWDAGWKQIYFMCFSKSADLRAKSDVELQNAYTEFKDARRALGMKIAQMAEEDGVI